MKIEFSDAEVCEIVKIYVSQRFQSAKLSQVAVFIAGAGAIAVVEKPVDTEKKEA